MSNQFQLGGAQPSKPTRFASLWNEYFAAGLITQRNPLRPGKGSSLQNKYYGSDNDSLLDGLNCEVSNRLTMVRRPGSTVYNSAIFEPIDNFYEFRLFDSNTEDIKVMADTATTVYDATGPSTKNPIFNKSAGAGEAYFQSVGNTLYMGDGVDQLKWVENAQTWEPNTEFTDGTFIVDSNGNLEVAWGGITVKVILVQVTNNTVSITLDSTDPNLPDNLMFLVGMQVTCSGFVNATFLNGQTLTISAVPQGDPAFDSNVIQAAFVNADYGPTEDSGIVTSGNGVSGATQPVWNTVNGGWTYGDGGQQWLNHGSAVELWGIVAPTTAPTVTQAPLANTFPAWAMNTYYSTSYLIQDSNNNIEKATTFGTTGVTEPVWNPTTGGTSPDNTVVWTNQGTGVYASSSSVASGQFVVQMDSTGNKYFFQAINAGNTSASAPTFSGALNSQTNDNGIIWVNIGVWADWQSITSTTLNGSFAVIPVMGGGTVIISANQNQTNGSNIALPTGYSNSNLLAWSTAGVGFSGSSVVTEGVFQSTTSGGITNSFFQGNFGGSAFPATSNWTAASWSSDATVVITNTGGFTFVAFTTALGDKLVFCAGSLANGSTVPIPSGFSPTAFQYIAGMSGSDNPGHIMQIVQQCSLDSSLTFTGIYNDGDGNSWNGPANVFGIFWMTGGGVTTESVTGGEALLIPTITGENLAVIQASVPKGSSYGLPSGFTSASIQSTCSPGGGTPAGGNHGHGYSCLLSGQEFVGFYADGNFVHEWDMVGNVFALVVAQSNTNVAQNMEVVDSNGKIEKIVVSGLSGQVAPQWSVIEGATTLDNTATWQNTGQGVAAGTLPWIWAYAYKNSITGAVSTASPLSGQLTIQENHYAFLQGLGSTDPQVDTIVIYRTVQGGSVLLEEDEIPNPKNGGTWQYVDTNPDTELNIEIEAAIDHANDPPPTGFSVMTYHLDRIWGAVNNSVFFSGGPDTTTGNGNEAFPPANVFVFPDKVNRLFASTLGLFVFTVSDVYLIQGTATVDFFSVPFCIGLGLQNYNAFAVNGSTIYMFTSDYQLASLDISSGVSEVGFPIGDQFLKSNWSANTARLTWHISGSPDKGLYVSDFSSGWFRLYPTPSPESGQTWAPFAALTGGCSQVQSVETSPGTHNLLIAPQTSGPILKRDDSVFTDNGQAYDSFFLLGSIVLAQPGQLAEIVFLTTDSIATGTRPNISIQIDEIAPFSDGMFEALPAFVPDPPQLSPSVSMYSNRYYVSQTQQPALCRSVQIRMDWGQDTVQNELLSLTIFGGFSNELS